MKYTVFILVLFTANIRAGVKFNTNSNPAEVYWITSSHDKTLLGRTPFELKELPKNEGHVLIEKAGKAPSHLYLPPDKKNMEINLQMTSLTKWDSGCGKQKDFTEVDQSLDIIIEIQSLMDQNKLETARLMIDELLKIHPHSISVRLMRANWLLISGRTIEAKDLYEELNRDVSKEHRHLKVSIEKMVKKLNGRSIAGEKP